MSEEKKEFIGILPSLMNQPFFTPEPPESFTIQKFNEIVRELSERDEERRNNGWKPEYVLTNQDAKELPLEVIRYISNNYRMLCSVRGSEILEERERERKQ